LQALARPFLIRPHQASPGTQVLRSEPGSARTNASTTVESFLGFSLEDRRFDPVEAFADYAVMAFDVAQLGMCRRTGLALRYVREACEEQRRLKQRICPRRLVPMLVEQRVHCATGGRIRLPFRCELEISGIASLHHVLNRRHRNPHHPTGFQHAAALTQEFDCLIVVDVLDHVLGENKRGVIVRERQSLGDLDALL
jgi:hypothetical protein